MGGELYVESKLGGGSRFWFTIPMVVGEPDEQQLGSRFVELDSGPNMRLAPGQGLTALVVDDHSVSRRLMAALLDALGAQAILAADGAEGIEMARQYRPEIILMDLRMKGMDGIEATRRLKEDAATSAIPVLAVTASPTDAAREAALVAGCSEFLAKPVRWSDLIGALERLLGARFEKVDGAFRPRTEQASEFARTPALDAVAERLREAASIGSISDLHAIAQKLILGDAEQVRLGNHIVRLTKQFDFEASEPLASREKARGVTASD